MSASLGEIQQNHSAGQGVRSLAKPAAGAVQHINLATGSELHLDFDVASAGFSRVEGDLLVVFNDGSGIRIDNFFNTGEAGLPEFVLVDGTRVGGGDFLQAQSPDIDISTAAGDSAPASGNGLNNYADEAGALLDGLDRFGSLGTDYWNRSAAESSEVRTPSALTVASASAPGGVPLPGTEVPGGPDVPGGGGEETGEQLLYNARAVLYTRDNTGPASGEHTLAFTLMGEDGTAVDPSLCTFTWKLPEGAEQYFEMSGTDAEGRLILSLTPAGLAALSSGELENLYNYLEVTVGDYSYTMQLVVNRDNSFDSEQENANSAVSGGVLENGALIHAEWHQGKLFASGDRDNVIDSSGLGDRVDFTGGLAAQGGSNTLHTNTEAGKSASVDISSADGTALEASDGGANTIDGGGAGVTNIVLSGSGFAAVTAKGGDNTIERTGGTLDIRAAGHGLLAEEGGANRFSGVADVAVTTVNGRGMQAAYGGVNSVNASGDITVIAQASGTSVGIGTFAGESEKTSLTELSSGGTLRVDVDSTAPGTVFGVLSQGNPDKASTGGTTGRAETHLVAKDIVITADSAAGSSTVGISARSSASSEPVNRVYTHSHVSVEADTVAIGAGRDAGAAAEATGNWDTLSGIATGLEVSSYGGIDVSTGTLDLYAAGSYAFGIRQTSNGGNPDGAGNVNSIDKGYDFGVHITGTAANDTFGIEAHSCNGAAAGIISHDVGRTVVDGGVGSDTLTVQAHAHGSGSSAIAYGLAAGLMGINAESWIKPGSGVGGGSYSSNEIRNIEQITIDAKSEGSSAYGLFGINRSTNRNDIIVDPDSTEALDLSISASANTAAGYGIGMAAIGGAENTVFSGKGDDAIAISAENRLGEAIGLHTRDRGQNSIDTGTGADTVSISAVGATAATGLSAIQASAKNSIVTSAESEVTITATAQSGPAHGMLADASYSSLGTSAENFVQSGTVTIEASSAAGDAYGMRATQRGSNTIAAAEGDGGIEVRISVAAGQGKEALAMFASGSGRNEITGSDGTDFIQIKGDVKVEGSSAANVVNTGSGGKAVIELDGKVWQNSLTLDTDGEQDVLILRAANAGEFEARFKDWLTNLNGNAMFDVLRVEVFLEDSPEGGVDLFGRPDLEWLADVFDADKLHSLSQEEYDRHYADADAFDEYGLAGGDAAAAASDAFDDSIALPDGQGAVSAVAQPSLFGNDGMSGDTVDLSGIGGANAGELLAGLLGAPQENLASLLPEQGLESFIGGRNGTPAASPLAGGTGGEAAASAGTQEAEYVFASADTSVTDEQLALYLQSL